jgi:hypothetical protein
MIEINAVQTWISCFVGNPVIQEEFEDTKGVIRIRKSKNNRQHNGQKKGQRDKQRSIKHEYKTTDRVTRTPLKTGGELRYSNLVRSY